MGSSSDLESLKTALGDDADGWTDHALGPFIISTDGNIAQAAAAFRKALAARREYAKLSIREVAEFYRAPALIRSHPDGCLFLLEDMKGGVARDNVGRPIVVALGMQHGSAREMQEQFAYISELIEAHNSSLAKPVHGACVVVEIRPRDASAPPSFRFPDRDVRSLFDMQRDIYPSSLFNTTHFCGLPRAVTWAFTLCKPFMRREAYNAMVLIPGFAHLPSVMPKESILTRWGGQLTFDIDAWVEYRAEKEGIPLDQLCPRSKGRRFDPKAVLATSADAMDDGAAATITAKALLAGEVSGKMPRVHGIVEKRGSGRGLFGTVRWKSKLLVVCAEIGCVYFDSDEISDKNKAARLMPLGDDGTKVEHRADRSGGANCFALVTPAREFLFSVPSADKATEWVAAIQAEIEAAQRTREEMRRNVEETARVHS